MPDYVRVRDDATGHEFSILTDRKVAGVTVIDKPAADPYGMPLPPKHRVLRAAAKAVPADPKKPAGEGTTTANQADKKE